MMPSGGNSARRGAWLAAAGCVQRVVGMLMLVALCLAMATPASALKPIVVTGDADRVEITTLGEAYEGRGDSLTVETAAGADGVTGRISVKATTQGTNPNWMVFALSNPTDKPVERWVTADRYTLSGSGVVWPDLDARRIEAVTPSIGFVPQRVKSDRADVFALTLEPGQTITYIAELSSERFARLYLWKPLEYEVKARDRQLFNGIMLGLSVLTALFLTVVFAANHKLIFPAAALFSWCVLAYLCVDFGFFHKIFNMKPEDNAVYRAAAESSMAASLVMFLYAFLRLGLTNGLIRMLSVLWILAQLSLVAIAAIDPRLAATFARFSFGLIGIVGGLSTLYLAVRGQDRAMHLLPPWIMFLVWIFLAGVTLTGRLSGEIFVSALIGGLVLILLLIGFVVTQFAFRSLEPLAGLAPTDSQLRALAVDGARSAVWEWSSRRDEIKTGAIIEQLLGLNTGELSVKVDEFLLHIHPADRERFRLSMWSVQERAGGTIRSEFRMRHADNSYRWFELEAASVETSDRRAVRCVGLMRDVTESKLAHERLLQDAVHCNLTGLPNRELLLDRLANTVLRAKSDEKLRPAVFFIDIDKFKSVNTSLGFVVGDSLLLNVARRLQRHLGPHDTLSRIGGDQFAILFVNKQDPRELAALAERVRRSLRAPIHIASQEVVLTGSLGIAIFDGAEETAGDLLKEAEIAMYRAKRSGSDRIEIFRPEMRGEPNDRGMMEATLRKAVERNQLRVLYQPIVYLPTEELAGFEALVRMEHPKLGLISPAAFIPIAEESDLIHRLGSFVLNVATENASVWQRELPRPEDHLFVSVNISSRQVLRTQLVQEIRHVLARAVLAKGSLKLEVTESLAMENPEHAVEILSLIKDSGAEIALDDFGTGYSSLAYLQRLPCDTIKLDRMLVRSAGAGDESGATIVRAIVALAHELGKKVVAEGVETADDVAFLRSIGCEFGQGYFYGEPMADRDVIDLLRIIRKSERKLQTHGFFKTKLRQRKRKQKKEEEALLQASTAAGAAADAGVIAARAEPRNGAAGNGAAANGAIANGALGRAPGPGAPAARAQALPQSTVRTRQPRPLPQAPRPAPPGVPAPLGSVVPLAAAPLTAAPPAAAPPAAAPAATAPADPRATNTGVPKSGASVHAAPAPASGIANMREGKPRIAQPAGAVKTMPPTAPPGAAGRPIGGSNGAPPAAGAGPVGSRPAATTPPPPPSPPPASLPASPAASVVPPPVPQAATSQPAAAGPTAAAGGANGSMRAASTSTASNGDARTSHPLRGNGAPPPQSRPSAPQNAPQPSSVSQPAAANGEQKAAPNGATVSAIDFSTLPPGIAASLARLAGLEPVPNPQPGAAKDAPTPKKGSA